MATFILTTSEDERLKAEEWSRLELYTVCVNPEGKDDGVCFPAPVNQATDPKGANDDDFLTALLPIKQLPAWNKED